MKLISALWWCLILLLLVEEALSSLIFNQNDNENELTSSSSEFFGAKLLKQNAAFNYFRRHLLSPPESSNITRIGRVFYPIGYGADPTGAEDSSGAILKAVEDAFELQNGAQLLPGINDLGGVVIDLQGGNYKLSQPLRFPSAGGNLVVHFSTFRSEPSLCATWQLLIVFMCMTHGFMGMRPTDDTTKVETY
ncbi:Pectin lyase fold containing protein [Trema orientale]|uniref:Pectin lyase fold containing protein n=1 Tax=Trema orientale TaxID=63057 RepID=A0A2P5ESR3_TREOI|nr:Pectin lyase fold containing protein [Trema orientale]